MRRPCLKLLFRSALLIGASPVLTTVLEAQQPFGATARISSRVLTVIGADSGKVMLALKLSGIPEIGLRNLKREQVVLVDDRGRSYTPSMMAVGSPVARPTSLLAAYMQPPQENLADRQYIFFVPPGSRTFELRVGTMKPVSITPVIGFPR